MIPNPFADLHRRPETVRHLPLLCRHLPTSPVASAMVPVRRVEPGTSPILHTEASEVPMAHSDPTQNTKTSTPCLVPCKWLCPECPIFTWNALGAGRALAGFCAKGWFGSHHNVHLR